MECKCETCIKKDCPDRTTQDSLRMVILCLDYMEHKPTNADRIRAMTDEELEAFLIDVDLDKAGPPFITEWGKWLQQPSEGDA